MTPTFTSFKRWTGHALDVRPDAQARRLWATVADELEPVSAAGSRAFVLASDRERLCERPAFPRDLLLLGAHDPYLDQRDRATLQSDKALQRRIWRTVANPGAIVLRGRGAGPVDNQEKGREAGDRLRTLVRRARSHPPPRFSEAHAAARNLELASTTFA